jgi:hypothetical protein
VREKKELNKEFVKLKGSKKTEKGNIKTCDRRGVSPSARKTLFLFKLKIKICSFFAIREKNLKLLTLKLVGPLRVVSASYFSMSKFHK